MIKFIMTAIALACLTVSEAWALLSDDFNPATPEPNPVWRFYDPYGSATGKSTLTFDGTNALISLPAGYSHDLWLPPDNKAPRLLQPQANTDFQIEEKVETPLTADTQSQGLIVQQSNDIFLRFSLHYGSNDNIRVFAAYVNGATTTHTVYRSDLLAYRDQYRNVPQYLQVIRSGDQWTFRYSYDRTTWTEAVTFTQRLTVTEVGFFAGTSTSNPALLSSIDYFMDVSAPITDTDTWLAPPPAITTWYGYNQPFGRFGSPGVSQKWANILGNASSDVGLSKLTYRLNGGPKHRVSFGPDIHQATRQDGRLVKTGDFNIEIARTRLKRGRNLVSIQARDSNGRVTNQKVALDYAPRKQWPMPYTVDWQQAKNPDTGVVDVHYVENIAHIVDGLWEITPSGIRTVQPGYDRTIAIGSKTWLPHYEVTVPFTLHSGFNGIGFAVGWQGHTGSRSPKIEWPLEALAWVRGPLSNATLEIMTYGGLIDWEVIQASQPVSLATNTTYLLKGRTELLTSTTSRFYLKIWPQSASEPVTWNLTADIPRRNGSVLLVAYKADATFGNVNIVPIPDSQP